MVIVKPRRQSLKTMNSYALALLLSLDSTTLRRLLLRIAVGGSLYACLAGSLGAFYTTPLELLASLRA
ncbi:hypothetical protein PINS_up016767 [Pythium insidiosum]|nr:hypothetical protein PINS_up016767 [Pythium insidiosum]